MREYCLQDNAVVTALIGLFKAFAEREKSKAASQAVDPTQLRVALGNLEGDKFKVGEEPESSLLAQRWLECLCNQPSCCHVMHKAPRRCPFLYMCAKLYCLILYVCMPLVLWVCAQ